MIWDALTLVWRHGGIHIRTPTVYHINGWYMQRQQPFPFHLQSMQTTYRLMHGLPWITIFAWRRHQMETFSALLALCALNSPHKGQWRWALMFSSICAWINLWVNNREEDDLRCYRAHYDAIVMVTSDFHEWRRHELKSSLHGLLKKHFSR